MVDHANPDAVCARRSDLLAARRRKHEPSSPTAPDGRWHPQAQHDLLVDLEKLATSTVFHIGGSRRPRTRPGRQTLHVALISGPPPYDGEGQRVSAGDGANSSRSAVAPPHRGLTEPPLAVELPDVRQLKSGASRRPSHVIVLRVDAVADRRLVSQPHREAECLVARPRPSHRGRVGGRIAAPSDPLIATSTASGACRAKARRSPARLSPVGSPCNAVLTSGEFASGRAAVCDGPLVPGRTHDALRTGNHRRARAGAAVRRGASHAAAVVTGITGSSGKTSTKDLALRWWTLGPTIAPRLVHAVYGLAADRAACLG